MALFSKVFLVVSDLKQIEYTCNDMEFSKNTLGHPLLSLVIDVSLLWKILLHSFQIRDGVVGAARKDAVSDGEAGVDDDEEDAKFEEKPGKKTKGQSFEYLSKQPVHQGRLMVDLLHEEPSSPQAHLAYFLL